MTLTVRPFGAAMRMCLLLLGLLALTQTAHADCANPAGAAGDMTYNTTYNVMAFCNGTNWISMAGATSVGVSDPRIGTISAGGWCQGNGAGTGLDCTAAAPSVSPSGITGDVQFNNGGSLGADSGDFTYLSNVLSAPMISTTALTVTSNATMGTASTGALTVTGNASITAISASIVSGTLIQVGNNGAACMSGLAGAQRYNSVSNTIDYCTGSAWMSLGPSATVPVAFLVTRNGVDQSITTSVYTKVDWTTKVFDTNSNFDLSTDRFTPTIPGYYVLSLKLAIGNGSPAVTYGYISKNGTSIASSLDTYSNGSHSVTVIAYANGSTDYFEASTYQATGSTVGLSGIAAFSYFTGSILGPQAGGGGGGTANPAGSTNDVQFNSGGLLAADTGNFTYVSGVLKAPIISATSFNGQYGSITTLYNPGTFSGNSIAANSVSSTLVSATTISSTYVQIQSATTTLSCGSNLAGTMRYTSGTMQVCDGSGWTNIGLGVPQGTIAAFALASCPSGWSEYTLARGRFLRGIDNGAAVDPSGTRSPGNQQSDAFQGHGHEFYVTANLVASGGGNGIRTNASTVADTGPFSSFVRNPISDGTNGTPRTANETRPANVAVTFCRYDGFQSQLATGVATLASLSDVSVAGATNGQVLTYSGGTWIASTTTAAGSTSGDRITSGTLSIIANTGSAYASLTTNGTTWGYLSSAASFIPYLQVNNLNAGNVSGTLVQTGASSATCGTGLYGSIRWNATSDTIQICNTAGWTSVASSSVPNTTISQGQNNYAAIFSSPNTLVTDSALYVDRTNHRIGIGTDAPSNTLTVSTTTNPMALFVTNGDGVNPVIQLKDNSPAQGRAGSINFLNGAGLSMGQLAYATGYNYMRMTTNATERMRIVSTGEVGIGTVTPASSLTIVGEAQVGNSGAACVSATNGGAIRYSAGALYYCNGSNTWTSLGGGGGSAAGSTGDIQFNTSGAFAADTGKFIWNATSHALGIGVSSPTASIDISQSDMSGISLNIANTNGTEIAFNGTPANANIVNFGNGSSMYVNTTNGPMYFRNGGIGTNNMVLRGGQLGVGGISVPSANLQVSGSFIVSSSVTPDSPSLFIGTNGGVSIGSTTNAWVNKGTSLYIARYISRWGLVIAGDQNVQSDFLLLTPSNAVDQHALQFVNSGNTFAIRLVTDAGGIGKSFFHADLTSGTVGISNTNPIAKLDITGTVSASDAIQVGSSSLTCAAGINGAIRYSSTSNTLQVCVGTVWTSLSSGTTAGGGSPAGSTGDIQFNTAGAFDADTGQLYWDKGNDRLGLGTTSPAQTLDVSGTIRAKTSANVKLILDTAATGQQAAIGLYGNGASKWLFGKATDDSLFIYDAPASRYVMNIYPSGNMALMAGGGNVGIGTTAPGVRLDVSGTSGEIARFAGSAAITDVNYLTVGGRAMFGYDGTSQNAAVQGIAAKGIEFNVNNATFGSGTAVVINTSGNMGIGTTAPGTPLEVSGSQAFRISELGGTQNPYMEWTRSGIRQAYMGYGTPGSSFYIAMENNNALSIIATATTVYGNMTATGNITFTQANSLATSTDLNTVIANGHYRLGGTPVNSPGAGTLDYGQMIVSRGLDTILQIGGDYLSNNLYFRGGNPSNIGGSGSWAAWRKVLYDGMGANVSIAGNITASAFLYSSDKRLKSDVTTLTGGLAKLDALNPVSFRFTADPNKTIQLGLIAQDVQKVYPEAIHADDKGFLKLDYPALIGPMVGMLKEMKQRVLVNSADMAKLQAANDNLELRITDLHKQVHALKADNDNLKAVNRTLKAANDNAMQRLDALERNQRAHGW